MCISEAFTWIYHNSVLLVMDWANKNEGFIALLGLLLAILSLPFFWKRLGRILPSSESRARTLKAEIENASKLKAEINAKKKRNKNEKHYGHFIIRDAATVLEYTEEAHSTKKAKPYGGHLLQVDDESIEFTSGSTHSTLLKHIAGRWEEVDRNKEDEDIISAVHVFRINYRDILVINWTDNVDGWDSQICCLFDENGEPPFSRSYYAEEIDNEPRANLKYICDVKDAILKPRKKRRRR